MSLIPFTPLQLLIGAIILIGFLLLTVILPARKKYNSPYEPLPSILTPSEQHFYKVLSSAVNQKAIIMTKVRIADLIKVKPTIKQRNFWFYFSKISQKHIDFVLIDPNNFKTICLIELDDKSHLSFNRRKRDRFINHVMAQTGIRLFHFRVQRRYKRNDILQTLSPCFSSL